MLPFWACCHDGCQVFPVRQSLVHWGLTACITICFFTRALLGFWQWETSNAVVQPLKQTYFHLSKQPKGSLTVEHLHSHLYIWSRGLCRRLLHRSQTSEREVVRIGLRQMTGLGGWENLCLPVRWIHVFHSRSACSGVMSSDSALQSV